MINQDFIDLINSGDAWAFVGSGPSIAAGLSNWEQSTVGALNYLSASQRADVEARPKWKASLKAEDYPSALSVIQASSSRAELLEAFRSSLGRPHNDKRIYSLIADWPFRNFVTTNLDGLMLASARASEPAALPVENDRESLRLMTREPSGVVFRLHGNLYPGSTSLLTTTDYDAAYGPGGSIGLLALELLTNRRFVIVGFGFKDPDLLRILRLAGQGSNPARPHYAVIGFRREDFHRAAELATEFGIVIIPYHITPEGAHSELDRVLTAYDWCILGRRGRRQAGSQLPRQQSPAVGGLTVANECLAEADPGRPELRRVVRTVCLSLLRDGPTSLAELATGLPLRLPLRVTAEEPIRHFIEEELLDLMTARQLSKGEEGYSLTPSGRLVAEDASRDGALLRDQCRASIGSRVTERLAGVTGADVDGCAARVFEYLERSCVDRAIALGQLMIAGRATTAELHRANVLSGFSAVTRACANDDEALAAISVIGEVLATPTEPERRFVGRLLQASFACQFLGMEPDSIRARRADLERTAFILDSNVVITLLAEGCAGQKGTEGLVQEFGRQHIRCTTTQRLVEEAARHAEWARQAFLAFGDTSPEVLDIIEGRNGFRPNLFISGFITSRERQPRLTSSKYFAQCFSGLRANRRIDASVVAAALGRRYAIDAVGPRREEQPLDVAFALIKTKRQERGTFRSDSQVWAEAEAVTTVANMSDLDSAEGPRSLFVSNSRVLDGLEGFPSRITIDLASLTHWINTVLPTNGGDRAAFESMIQSLYDEGIILFDRTAFRRVFDSTVSAADDQFAMALNQHRELVEEILGPDPARAFAEVDDLSKPIAARGIDSRVLQKLRVRAEEQERRAQRAELRARITDKDKVELEKLRHEKAARHRTAIRRKRGAAAKKAKRGRRGKSGRRGKRRKR